MFRRPLAALSLDRARPRPFTTPTPRTKAEAHAELAGLVERLLPAAVDEGSAAVLDAVLTAWAADWLQRVDTEHLDHLGALDRLVGMAEEAVAAAEAEHQSAAHRLRLADTDLTAARTRLGA
ncbi:hypothetical protein [Pseudonocardia oroxyli]|uniref:Excreted virulence factor EspC, type VII ESX diderm n=1 Tax=Pseudonocardia oroxyli TaxID=366584 RepID=A0A1G8CS37_PSEOR|nr:hypothetical protein [Pseudonocardia oroxyli]SDH48305.1 hypothetical protein SAMN05216377_12341 [Pseudonocardia oroxyli]